MEQSVLDVKGLRKSYSDLAAVDGVDIAVEKGEIFGLLGHNGTGKTTAIECILGIRRCDAGSIAVFGRDPVKHRKALFTRVGVQFQQTSFQDKLRLCIPGARTGKGCLQRFIWKIN